MRLSLCLFSMYRGVNEKVGNAYWWRNFQLRLKAFSAEAFWLREPLSELGVLNIPRRRRKGWNWLSKYLPIEEVYPWVATSPRNTEFVHNTLKTFFGHPQDSRILSVLVVAWMLLLQPNEPLNLTDIPLKFCCKFCYIILHDLATPT